MVTSNNCELSARREAGMTLSVHTQDLIYFSHEKMKGHDLHCPPFTDEETESQTPKSMPAVISRQQSHPESSPRLIPKAASSHAELCRLLRRRRDSGSHTHSSASCRPAQPRVAAGLQTARAQRSGRVLRAVWPLRCCGDVGPLAQHSPALCRRPSTCPALSCLILLPGPGREKREVGTWSQSSFRPQQG